MTRSSIISSSLITVNQRFECSQNTAMWKCGEPQNKCFGDGGCLSCSDKRRCQREEQREELLVLHSFFTLFLLPSISSHHAVLCPGSWWFSADMGRTKCDFALLQGRSSAGAGPGKQWPYRVCPLGFANLGPHLLFCVTHLLDGNQRLQLFLWSTGYTSCAMDAAVPSLCVSAAARHFVQLCRFQAAFRNL